MSAANASLFRHSSFCKPGMWLANISMALGCIDEGWHLHADCVVDDFGTLVPIEVTGLTVQRTLIGSQS